MATTTIDIPFNFSPRDYQIRMLRTLYSYDLDAGYKRACLVWHRRTGKDKTLLNYMISQAMQRVGVYYYLFPTYSQGKKALWRNIGLDGFRFLRHFHPSIVMGKPNQAEMSIQLKHPTEPGELGSIFQVIGTDNYDSVRGTNPVGCVFSEWGYQNPVVWDIISPIIEQNGGWAIFNYTPCGRNHGYTLYKMAQENPAWFCERLTVDDTGGQAVTPAMIQAERDRGMSEEMILQEYYCSFDAGRPGAYYATYIRNARDEKRITDLSYIPAIPVDTYWDIGVSKTDKTSIWFVQEIHGEKLHVIDYYENTSEGLPHYVDYINKTNYTYGRHVWPHDGNMTVWTTGKTRLNAAHKLGIQPELTSRPQVKEDGIEMVRQILPKCYFDAANCEKGLDALASYHCEYDEEKRVLLKSPVHDWSSHAADSFQTVALGNRLHIERHGNRIAKTKSQRDWDRILNKNRASKDSYDPLSGGYND